MRYTESDFLETVDVETLEQIARARQLTKE